MSDDVLSKAARDYFSLNSLFPYQRLVITGILEAARHPAFNIQEDPPHTRRIVILPTGAGKSLCFQLPAVLLPNPTLIVFPLLSLLKDQERRLKEQNIPCCVLRGGQSAEERQKIWKSLENNTLRIILSNPETLLNPSVIKRLRQYNLSHIVIDEAHCISEWGKSFRPAYLKLKDITEGIPVVTAFTATASPTTLEDIRYYLFPDGCTVLNGNPDRQNIHYSVIESICSNQSLVSILEGNTALGPIERPALIFASSRITTCLLAHMLREQLQTDQIFFYHAGLNKEEKEQTEDWFFSSRDGILCATCAYGMGVDKADIRSVIHFEAPTTIESYVQETGRAGRDKNISQALLIWNNALEAKRSNTVMAGYAQSTQCRRQYLMKLLGSSTEVCFGCDSCQKLKNIPVGVSEILTLCSRYPRRFTKNTAIDLLSGSTYTHRRKQGREMWGTLRDWKRSDIVDAINNLISQGLLRSRTHIPWKDTLTALRPDEEPDT